MLMDTEIDTDKHTDMNVDRDRKINRGKEINRDRDTYTFRDRDTYGPTPEDRTFRFAPIPLQGSDFCCVAPLSTAALRDLSNIF